MELKEHTVNQAIKIVGTKIWTKQDRSFYYYSIYKKPSGKYTVAFEEEFIGILNIKWESTEASLWKCKLGLFLYHMGSKIFSEPLRTAVSFSIKAVAMIFILLLLFIGSIVVHNLVIVGLGKIGIFVQTYSYGSAIIGGACFIGIGWIIVKCEKWINHKFPYFFK